MTQCDPIGYETGLRDTVEVRDTGGSIAQGPDPGIPSPDIPRSIPSSSNGDRQTCE